MKFRRIVITNYATKKPRDAFPAEVKQSWLTDNDKNSAWVNIALEGEVKKRKVKLTNKELDEMIKNFYEHDATNLKPAYFDHKDAMSAVEPPADGYVRALYRDGSKLWGFVEFTDKAAAVVREGGYRNASIAYVPDYTGDDGENIGAYFWSLAIVNQPQIKGMEPFTLSQKNNEDIETSLYLNENKEELHMAKEAEPTVLKIVEEDSKWCVYSKDGTKNLGCYDTKKEAEARLAQVEAHKNENLEAEAEDKVDLQDEVKKDEQKKKEVQDSPEEAASELDQLMEAFKAGLGVEELDFAALLDMVKSEDFQAYLMEWKAKDSEGDTPPAPAQPEEGVSDIQMSAKLQTLGMKDINEIVETLSALKESNENLSAELTALKREKAEAKVNKAIAEGKFSASFKSIMLTAAMENEKEFDTMVSKATVSDDMKELMPTNLSDEKSGNEEIPTTYREKALARADYIVKNLKKDSLN